MRQSGAATVRGAAPFHYRTRIYMFRRQREAAVLGDRKDGRRVVLAGAGWVRWRVGVRLNPATQKADFGVHRTTAPHVAAPAQPCFCCCRQRRSAPTSRLHSTAVLAQLVAQNMRTSRIDLFALRCVRSANCLCRLPAAQRRAQLAKYLLPHHHGFGRAAENCACSIIKAGPKERRRRSAISNGDMARRRINRWRCAG